MQKIQILKIWRAPSGSMPLNYFVELSLVNSNYLKIAVISYLNDFSFNFYDEMCFLEESYK